MACFSFILTEKCDWSCEYCQFPLLERPNELTTDKIVHHVPYIREVISKTDSPYIEIQGGEVGLIGPNMMALFLEELDHKVIVSTNGLFMEKGYHLNKRIRPYIRELVWHLCDKPGDYELGIDYTDEEIFINKGIVHDNIEDIVNFINKNPYIAFNYVELECDIRTERTPNTDDYRRLHDAISSLSNVTDNALQTIQKRIDVKEHKRDKCKNFHPVVSINLAAETICLCQRVLHTNVSLSREALIGKLKTFPNKYFHYYNTFGCDSCIRLCSGRYEFDVRDVLKLRRTDFES